MPVTKLHPTRFEKVCKNIFKLLEITAKMDAQMFKVARISNTYLNLVFAFQMIIETDSSIDPLKKTIFLVLEIKCKL